jgi:hypothetical protein
MPSKQNMQSEHEKRVGRRAGRRATGWQHLPAQLAGLSGWLAGRRCLCCAVAARGGRAFS